MDDPHKLHGVNSFRQFAHDAEPRAVPGLRRLENPKVPHAQHFGQPPAHAPGGAVEVGVAGVERDPAADGPLDAPLDGISRVEPLERAEDDRMMRDHQIAPFGFGLVQHLFGNIHGQQGLVHLVVGAADDKSRIVIRFLPLKWGKAFDDVGYLSDNHMS